MVRMAAVSFLKAEGVPRSSCYEVIDTLLTANVIEDTVAGLRAKT